jgi:hypothetical protein
MINLIIYLAYSGWIIIRKSVLEKFKFSKNVKYQTFLDLLGNCVPVALDVYAILFREGHFEQHIKTILRLLTQIKKIRKLFHDHLSKFRKVL